MLINLRGIWQAVLIQAIGPSTSGQASFDIAQDRRKATGESGTIKANGNKTAGRRKNKSRARGSTSHPEQSRRVIVSRAREEKRANGIRPKFKIPGT